MEKIWRKYRNPILIFVIETIVSFIIGKIYLEPIWEYAMYRLNVDYAVTLYLLVSGILVALIWVTITVVVVLRLITLVCRWIWRRLRPPIKKTQSRITASVKALQDSLVNPAGSVTLPINVKNDLTNHHWVDIEISNPETSTVTDVRVSLVEHACFRIVHGEYVPVLEDIPYDERRFEPNFPDGEGTILSGSRARVRLVETTEDTHLFRWLIKTPVVIHPKDIRGEGTRRAAGFFVFELQIEANINGLPISPENNKHKIQLYFEKKMPHPIKEMGMQDSFEHIDGEVIGNDIR